MKLLKLRVVHSPSVSIETFICFASSVQYANILMIVFLLQQPFIDD